MKKGVAIIAISLILFVGCSQQISYWDSYVESFPNYNFEGVSEATFDDRYFRLEVMPQNIPEELVANDYYYNIAGEFEKLSNIYGENEALKISASNTRKNFQEKVYIKEFVIKNLSVAKRDELKTTKSPMISSLKDYIEKYSLTEFTIIRVEVSMTYSQEAINRGPQLGEGTYVRSFLCGKGNDEKEWKIYEVYWE